MKQNFQLVGFIELDNRQRLGEWFKSYVNSKSYVDTCEKSLHMISSCNSNNLLHDAQHEWKQAFGSVKLTKSLKSLV
jgi:hypothetical protein